MLCRIEVPAHLWSYPRGRPHLHHVEPLAWTDRRIVGKYRHVVGREHPHDQTYDHSVRMGRKLRHLPTRRQWTWESDFIARGSEVTPDGRDFDPGELDALAVKLMAKKARAEHW